MHHNLLSSFLIISLSVLFGEFSVGKGKEGSDPTPKLRPFISDGCTLPDSLSDQKYKSCCITHDIAYWIGGTLKDKNDADVALVHCIKSKGAPEWTAGVWQTVLMNFGINQWGADWVPKRKNEPLSKDEWDQVNSYKNLFSEGIPVVRAYSTRRQCSLKVNNLLKDVTNIGNDSSNVCYNLTSSKVGVITQIIYSSKCRNGFLVFQSYLINDNIKEDNLAGYGDCSDEIRPEKKSLIQPNIFYEHSPPRQINSSK